MTSSSLWEHPFLWNQAWSKLIVVIACSYLLSLVLSQVKSMTLYRTGKELWSSVLNPDSLQTYGRHLLTKTWMRLGKLGLQPSGKGNKKQTLHECAEQLIKPKTYKDLSIYICHKKYMSQNGVYILLKLHDIGCTSMSIVAIAKNTRRSLCWRHSWFLILPNYQHYSDTT